MTTLQTVALLLVALTGTTVVFTRDPRRQVVVAGVFGLTLAVLFLLFGAPDVALSQVVVAVIGMPVLLLLALHGVEGDDG